MHIYPWQTDPTLPPLLDHRSLQHHYTESVGHIEECTYTHGRQTPPLLIDHTSLQHHYTESDSQIEECTYT